MAGFPSVAELLDWIVIVIAYLHGALRTVTDSIDAPLLAEREAESGTSIAGCAREQPSLAHASGPPAPP